MRPALLALFLLAAPVAASADLLPSSWNPYGFQDYSLFGVSVAPAGDVNHDGYSDVLVGAPDYSVVNGEGRVYLFLGGAHGLAGAPAWSWSPPQAGSHAGWCVAGAGDINGDGVDDILVGAPLWDSPIAANAGAVFVFLGSPSGPGASPWDTLYAGGTNAEFGSSVATAGDVNDDGKSDVIVGAPYLSSGQFQEGAIFVYLGAASDFGASAVFTIQANYPNAHLGTSVSGAGDVNGDGFADVIVGAPDLDANGLFGSGAAWVYRGTAFGIGAALGAYAGEADSAQAGYSVAGAGDVNGDGYADIVVGAPGTDGFVSRQGRADVYLGGPTGPSSVSSSLAFGFDADERFGSSVATAGDLDGDGYADVLVGGDRAGNDYGRVMIGYGGKGGLVFGGELDGAEYGAGFATSIATAGDADGDGFSELLVGAPTQGNGSGAVFTWIGKPGGPVGVPGTPIVASGPGTGFGGALAILPSVEPSVDPFPALLVGEGVYGAGQAGRAHVIHGAWNGVAPFATHVYDGSESTQRFGGEVANVGDVNRDGYTDFVIGSPGWDGGGPAERGKATLYLGGPSGPTVGSWTVEGAHADDQFGSDVSGGGDVNGDGYHDVVVGNGTFDSDGGFPDCGRVWFFPGGPGGLGATSWFRTGGAPVLRFGKSAAIVGDLDADGYSDVALGVFPYPNGPGSIWVYFGSPAGPEANPGWILNPTPPVSSFWNVAAAGDWNGDGVDDLLIGSPMDADGKNTILVYPGSRARSQPQAPLWYHREDVGGLGYSLAGGYDINGDGYADVIAGQDQWSNGQADEGRVLVFYGRPLPGTSQNLAPDLAIESDAPNYHLGQSLALGDLNDDGFADIAAGSYDGTGRVFAWFGGGEGVPLHTSLTEYNALGAIRWSPARVDDQTRFGMGDILRSPAGRSRVSQRFEVRFQGEPFTGVFNRADPNNWPTSAPTADGSLINVGMQVDAPYKATTVRVRRRMVTGSPYFPRSRWLSPGARAFAEYDVKTAGVTTGAPVTPPSFGIAGAAPNPARAGTTITFALAQAGPARLDVFAVDGRHVRTLARGTLPAGPSSRVWDGRDDSGASAAPGVYFVFLREGAAESRTRVVLLP